MLNWPINILNISKCWMINPTCWIMLDDHATAMSNETKIKRNIVGSNVGWNVGFV